VGDRAAVDAVTLRVRAPMPDALLPRPRGWTIGVVGVWIVVLAYLGDAHAAHVTSGVVVLEAAVISGVLRARCPLSMAARAVACAIVVVVAFAVLMPVTHQGLILLWHLATAIWLVAFATGSAVFRTAATPTHRR
jgi:hypothetical protein